MAPGLLGPPELQSSAIATTTTTQSPPSNPPSDPTKSLSYSSSGNPCLDFFHVAEETPYSELIQRLQHAWEASPQTTLKLILKLRGVRGSGKNNKEGFYAAALWLHKHHPKTLALNVGVVSRIGSLKDLLEILFRVLEGFESRKRMKTEWDGKKAGFFAQKWTKKPAEEGDLKKGKALKIEKKASRAKKAIDRYTHDPEYKFLYDCVCDVFADLLREDLRLLREEKRDRISLAAKWCPSLDSSYDEYLLICERIARKVFPREAYKEYEGVEEAHYAYKVRTRLRKEVLVPLRAVLDLPEVYMCAKRWREIPYDMVASKAMDSTKKVFLKRDRDGFEEYLEEVENGERSIAAGALLPSDIVSGLNDSDEKFRDVAVLQWGRMVDDLAKQGELINATAAAYSSVGDQYVGMMLLVSELTSEPWKGKVMTWSEEPEFYSIEGEDVADKVTSIQNMAVCESVIDLRKVFDKILEYTIEEKLSEHKMLRRVFVFIDEEFANASVHPWEAEYAEAKRKFQDRGVQRVPEIVCWNLKGSLSVPVRCDQPGVAVVSGLSKNLLTLFLDDGGALTPETVMNAAISRLEYDSLVVHD